MHALRHLQHTHTHTQVNHNNILILIHYFKVKKKNCYLVFVPGHHQQPLSSLGFPRLQGGCGQAGGGDAGWLRWLSGGGRRGRCGLVGGRGHGWLPVRHGQVQDGLVTPFPLVALNTLTGVGLPFVTAATVAMETGAAGTGVCEKL